MRTLGRTAAGLALLLCAGCLAYRGPHGVREQLEAGTGVRMHREFGFKMGYLCTKLACGIARMAADEPLPLRGLSGIGVVTYTLDGPSRGIGDLELRGWQTLLRVRDHGDDATVLAQLDGERILGLLLIVEDADEVTVARLRGRLERIFEAAVDRSLQGRGPGALGALARSPDRSRRSMQPTAGPDVTSGDGQGATATRAGGEAGSPRRGLADSGGGDPRGVDPPD